MKTRVMIKKSCLEGVRALLKDKNGYIDGYVIINDRPHAIVVFGKSFYSISIDELEICS